MKLFRARSKPPTEVPGSARTAKYFLSRDALYWNANPGFGRIWRNSVIKRVRKRVKRQTRVNTYIRGGLPLGLTINQGLGESGHAVIVVF
jgi:hypothetical protein